jgi:hypothetical protein
MTADYIGPGRIADIPNPGWSWFREGTAEGG